MLLHPLPTVKCGDGNPDADRDSLEFMERYERELRRKSPLSASVMFNVRLSCAGWKSRTKWNFVGEYHDLINAFLVEPVHLSKIPVIQSYSSETQQTISHLYGVQVLSTIQTSFLDPLF